jgi:transketolase C-terminal domain/subunit
VLKVAIFTTSAGAIAFYDSAVHQASSRMRVAESIPNINVSVVEGVQ